MTSVLARPEFEYGNTRLRARRLTRLSAAQLIELGGRDIDALQEALAATAFGVEVKSALARGGGTRRLHDAVRAHQARELEELRRFYQGRARELVDLLLAGFDGHNLLVLLRGILRRADEEQVLRDIVPAGVFSGALAREIVRQREPAAAIALLVGWHLPDPVTARTVARAFEVYERDADLARLDETVTAVHTERVAGELARFGDEAGDMRAALTRRVDDANVVVLLRLRAAPAGRDIEGLPAAAPWLPGGAITVAELERALRQAGAADTAAVLRAAASRLREPLESWARDGDAAAAQRVLDRDRLLDEIALYHRGAPMGIAVPIAYSAELELEARNVRVLIEGAASGLTASELQGQLVLAGTRR